MLFYLGSTLADIVENSRAFSCDVYRVMLSEDQFYRYPGAPNLNSGPDKAPHLLVEALESHSDLLVGRFAASSPTKEVPKVFNRGDICIMRSRPADRAILRW